MRRTSDSPNRIHLLCPANPAGRDVARFGYPNTRAYLDEIRANLPAPYVLTCNRRLLEAEEDARRGGRRDDALRIRDLQAALADAGTRAIVATSGGAYLTRILPHVDFSPLKRRREPLWLFGFSELTNLVNVVASYPGGRGVYWLCPNYLAWKVRPARAARAEFAAFWRTLPRFWEHTARADAGSAGERFDGLRTVAARLVRGRLKPGPIRVLGGCLSVLAANLAGPLARRIRPLGRWLLIEDIHEEPYRIDRHLAALKLAGWFEQIAGVIVGDFHTQEREQVAAVLELLPFHLPSPRRRAMPVLVAPQVGHVWPMQAVVLNRPLTPAVRRREVVLELRGGR